MNNLDHTSDGDLPSQGSTLGDWRFFVFRNIGPDTTACAYIETLCEKFGPEYEIDLEPIKFLEHIGMVAFTASVEAECQARKAA